MNETKTKDSTKKQEGRYTKSKSEEKRQLNKVYSETIDDTEFQLQNHDGKVAIYYRGQRMSRETWDSIEEAERYVMSKPWAMIEMVAIGVAMNINGYIDLQKKTKVIKKKKGE